ncbi:MAG TPA: alkaline phosphatase family protein [Terriglobales bacterium]|jgi:arylsulfatase A-like enzyme
MRSSPIWSAVVLLLWLLLCATAFSSAYNAHPKLVVVITIDQFRGDYLERYHDQFGNGGFRLLLERGAYFSDCSYDYVNTRTAPGHATLFTGAYTNGHGILSNEWWDPKKKRRVTSVQDDATRIVGVASTGPGASPHNLQASTLGDELKLATLGNGRVFAISLKDRAAILPGGFAGDGVYWIEPKSGVWITSTYYRKELPAWVSAFNQSKRAEKYLNKEWRDSKGNVLRTTNSPKGSAGPGFYEIVGSTPFANEYELEFAREMMVYEHLGEGGATDLLSISLSANDILGHQVGPDAPEAQAMVLAMDRQLAEFFDFLGHQVGLANVWIALSADHGVAPLASEASKLRIPAANLDAEKIRAEVNAALARKFTGRRGVEYVKSLDYPLAFLDEDALAPSKVKEEEAERAAGEALRGLGLRGYVTRAQLAQGAVPDTPLGHQFLHSYSSLPGWYVIGVPAPFTVGVLSGTDHASPYTYDTHVPLAFYGLAFQPGVYRRHAEPVDLAVTLASLLGINAPTHAVGRVLVEALAASRPENSTRPPASHVPEPPGPADEKVQPTAVVTPGVAQ